MFASAYVLSFSIFISMYFLKNMFNLLWQFPNSLQKWVWSTSPPCSHQFCVHNSRSCSILMDNFTGRLLQRVFFIIIFSIPSFWVAKRGELPKPFLGLDAPAALHLGMQNTGEHRRQTTTCCNHANDVA